MDMFDEIHNLAVVGMHETFTKPESLDAAAAAFDAAGGDTREKLAAAITAAAQLHLRHVQQLELPNGWRDLTVKDLRALADTVGVHIPYSYNRDDIVQSLQSEASKRQRLSQLKQPQLDTPDPAPAEAVKSPLQVNITRGARHAGITW